MRRKQSNTKQKTLLRPKSSQGLQSVGTVEGIEGGNAAVIFGGMRTKMRLERLELAADSKPMENHASFSAYNISRETRKAIDFQRQTSIKTSTCEG